MNQFRRENRSKSPVHNVTYSTEKIAGTGINETVIEATSLEEVTPTNIGGILVYPQGVSSDPKHTSMMAISVMDFIDYSSMNSVGDYWAIKDELKQEYKSHIYLPMTNLTVAYNHEYKTAGMDILQRMISAYMDADGLAEGIGDSMTTLFESITGQVSSKYTGLQTGEVYNDQKTARYQGSAIRTLPLTVIFTPRNRNELLNIGNIIRTLKYYSAASIGSNTQKLMRPSTFIIEEISKKQRLVDPLKFGPAFCSSITVNSTPDGSWRAFEATGDPIKIQLELNFTEIKIVTKDAIRFGL